MSAIHKSSRTRELPEELRRIAEEVKQRARAVGLDFWEVRFELLDSERLNEVAAYGGFPTRYPHWKFGMAYEELIKGYAYGLSKIYELVINNDPCYAYLMAQNGLVDQKLVMAHVCGHADFFKNNMWFAPTNRKMMDVMANHGNKVRSLAERHGHDVVENFLDACLSLENLIDIYSPYIKRQAPEKDEESSRAEELASRKLPSSDYMDRYVNPPEFLEAQRRLIEERIKKQVSFPKEPQRDVLLFLLEHAPLKPWQRTLLSIVREEAYYFAPQGMTKVMNEGWACLVAGTRVFTESGAIRMDELVAGDGQLVSDGETTQRVYDQHIIRDHPTIALKTRRGLSLEGSNNHRVLMADGATWKRLDELKVGDKLAISGAAGLWPKDEVMIAWAPEERLTLQGVASRSGVSIDTVLRHREGKRVRAAATIKPWLEAYESEVNQALPRAQKKRAPIRVPELVDQGLAAFLGYLVGDGHISRVKRHLGLTSGDVEQIARFEELGRKLFEVSPKRVKDGNRWRAFIDSETLSDFLVDGLGLTHGPSAGDKAVPEVILRSPKAVVAAFIRAYFDCDACAGKQGVILSSKSDALSSQVQLLLLNFGILSRRRRQTDGVWHLHIAGASAKVYAEEIGFGLARKQRELESYIEGLRWFKKERWTDTVVALEPGRADVYDISVTETHRYAAAGFINHNSFWHSKLMTEGLLTDAEVIDYADRHSGTVAASPGSLNPYKVGIELFRDIEDRWNKGRFGKEWEDCDNLERLQAWDKKLGIGREKIFEVRRIHNDVTFIDAFLTEEFCKRHKLFVFDYNRQTGEYVISSRSFKDIKQRLLSALVNFGQPVIEVVDANHMNRGELYLKHRHEGTDLQVNLATDTLRNLATIWSRPVHIETEIEGRRKLFSHDGKKHGERTL